MTAQDDHLMMTSHLCLSTKWKMYNGKMIELENLSTHLLYQLIMTMNYWTILYVPLQMISRHKGQDFAVFNARIPYIAYLICYLVSLLMESTVSITIMNSLFRG